MILLYHFLVVECLTERNFFRGDEVIKRLVVLAVICVMVFSFSGCSKEKGEDKSEKKTGVLQEIKKRNKLVVGTEADFAPFEFVEDGKIVGYGPDILAEVAKSLGVEVEQLDVPFSGIFTGLNEKKYDFIASAISVTAERQEKFNFTVPIADNKLVLVKGKGNASINKLEDMGGKVIGCNVGSFPEKELVKYNEKLKAEGKQEVEIKTYTGYAGLLLDLKNGRIDGAIGSEPIIYASMKGEPDVFTIVAPLTKEFYLSWALRKEDEDLLKVLNEEILKLKKSGKLAELQQKWFGTTWDLPDEL